MFISKPPMGWNSWNTFGHDINEDVIKKSADILISSGLKDAGYEYIVIDDCWSLKERDENGRLVADPKKFPSGMKALADYIHSKGLKFGMYSCAGHLTCAGYPGSFEHEWDDARSFAEWGVDYLKYDYCFHPQTVQGYANYRRMGLALANCGRDILYSACSWGADGTKHWVKSSGANIWRSTGDLFDNWQSLKDHSLSAVKSLEYSSVNSFADMDMLIVGINGNGKIGVSGLSLEEYKMHFALWALLGSPLMIGCDIKKMDNKTKAILTNAELIKINQDPAQNQPFMLGCERTDENQPYPTNEIFTYAKLLDNGDIAIGIFNFSDSDMSNWDPSHISTDILGLPESTGKTLLMTNVYTGEQKLVTNGIYRENVPAHSCAVYRAKVVDKR